MTSGHKHDGSIDRERVAELDKLSQFPQFQQAMQAYTKLDGSHDVPYVGGSSWDWKTVYFDHQFTTAVARGKFVIGGKTINPIPTARVHEIVEGSILHLWEVIRSLLGWPESQRRYLRAHDIADVAERLAVEHHGIDWDAYQSAFKPFIRLDEHEQINDPAPRLLLDPYQDDAKMMAVLARAGGRTTEELGETSGPTGRNMTGA